MKVHQTLSENTCTMNSAYVIPQKRPYVIPHKRKPLENRTNFIVTPVFAEAHLASVPREMLKPEFRYLNKEN